MLKLIEALTKATTWSEYRSIRKSAERLDPVAQLAAVDSFILARRRITMSIGGAP